MGLTGATAEGPEPFELLRHLELLRSLDDTTLEAAMEGVEPVQLREGQVLVRQGELDDTLYAVASGTVLGEVLGGAWTATIEAESFCLLYPACGGSPWRASALRVLRAATPRLRRDCVDNSQICCDNCHSLRLRTCIT